MQEHPQVFFWDCKYNIYLCGKRMKIKKKNFDRAIDIQTRFNPTLFGVNEFACLLFRFLQVPVGFPTRKGENIQLFLRLKKPVTLL